MSALQHVNLSCTGFEKDSREILYRPTHRPTILYDYRAKRSMNRTKNAPQLQTTAKMVCFFNVAQTKFCLCAKMGFQCANVIGGSSSEQYNVVNIDNSFTAS